MITVLALSLLCLNLLAILRYAIIDRNDARAQAQRARMLAQVFQRIARDAKNEARRARAPTGMDEPTTPEWLRILQGNYDIPAAFLDAFREEQ